MLPDFVDKRLKRLRVDLPQAWELWQHKTLNIHRGVIRWDATSTPCTLSEIRDRVRLVVREQFRPSWWRGFGFGVVVSLRHMDDSFNQVADLIDVRNNRKGTWQWVVMHLPAVRTAVGICTWTEGYLAPVYHDLLSQLRNSGFTCESHRKDMDALIKTLVGVQEKLRFARKVVGRIDGLLE